MKSIPSCHPLKRYGAKGLCILCYNEHLKITNPNYAENCRKIAKEARQTKIGKLKTRNRSYIQRYGITLNEVLSLIAQQEEKCKICLITFKSSMSTHVDHDHKTGKVRGILCARCNGIMAKVDADISIINRISMYKGIK